MSKRSLKLLAKRVFQLERREVWLGGKGMTNWPKELLIGGGSDYWHEETTWTLSPGVELGGYMMRVCVSSRPHYYYKDYYDIVRERDYSLRRHAIRVFCDDRLVHPGGIVDGLFNFLPTWSARIAKQEIAEGGQTGPVDQRDLLLEEAAQRLRGITKVNHTPLALVDKEALLRAMDEVEALEVK